MSLRTRAGDKTRNDKTAAMKAADSNGPSGHIVAETTPGVTLKRVFDDSDRDHAPAVAEPAKRQRIETSGPAAVVNTTDKHSGDSDHTIVATSTPPLSDTHPDGMDYVGVDHVDPAALSRATGFFAMADPVNGRYNISNLPPSVKWGTKFDTEKYLCDKANRKVTVWLVGVVKSAWFATSAGDPVPRVNVSVKPVRVVDLNALHQLFYRGNPKPERVPDRASASRFQTRKVKGQTAPQAYIFDRVFDATVKFKGKSVMRKLPPTQVGRGDFVLVEAFGWTDWNITLELTDLSVIFEAPLGYIDEDDDTPPIEVDDDL